jgi:hypothetical protein
MGDIHVTFGIITRYFVQWPSYILRCTPSSTFIESIIFYYSSFHKSFGHLLGPGSFNSPKRPLARKQASLSKTFGGVEFISTFTIAPAGHLQNWALVV